MLISHTRRSKTDGTPPLDLRRHALTAAGVEPGAAINTAIPAGQLVFVAVAEDERSWV